MNKERFHNALALSLGYERIVKDNRITIEVEEAADPWVTLKIQGLPDVVRFKASEGLNQSDMDCLDEGGYEDIKMIIDAVHQAYIQTTTKPF